MNNKENKICSICGNPVCNGIIINSKVICRKCECDIITTETTDDRYDINVNSISKILFSK